MTYRVVSNFTEFSDDILLHIFSFLSAWDLLNIFETCQRLNKIGRDHSLWKNADFSDGYLTAAQLTRRVVPCLQPCTKKLHICGRKGKLKCQYKWKTDLITPALAKSIGKKCPNLQELYLGSAIVDAKKFKISSFGEFQQLKTLCIYGCEFIHLPSPVPEGSYFKNMHTILPNLEILEISSCNWINDYDLMVLSKLDCLKKLILKCDLRIGFTIAYLSVSFRFGFKNLEELDLRGTSLRNCDVQSVVQNGKLKSLSIGPVGRVKRLSDDANDGLNLVMSDPNRREEPKQQVVIINLGPNGPNWRQANEEELDKMGLQWVKNGLNRYRQTLEKEEQHFFFGKEGKIIQESSGNTSGECSNESGKESNKRKLSEDEEEDESSSKRSRKSLENEHENLSSEDEDSNDEANLKDDCDENPLVGDEDACENAEEGNLPDVCLSDVMIHAFRDHAQNMQSLVLAGCAITNNGLLELIRYIPRLKYIDVTNTHVTEEGLHEAQLILPECHFVRSTR